MIGDGIQAGWQHATWAFGWALGALPVLLGLALLVAAILAIDVPHRVRVHQLRRQTRRSGRDARLPIGNGGY